MTIVHKLTVTLLMLTVLIGQASAEQVVGCDINASDDHQHMPLSDTAISSPCMDKIAIEGCFVDCTCLNSGCYQEVLLVHTINDNIATLEKASLPFFFTLDSILLSYLFRPPILSPTL